MQEENKEIKEKCVVFCPLEKNADKDFQIEEIFRLCESAGLEVEKVFTQSLEMLNRRTIMGTGKLEEISEFLRTNACDVLVVDFVLSGSQMRNLSDELDVKVLDRILLIIDIFAQKARSKEGKVEVKLAQNRYLLSRLSSLRGTFGRFGGSGAGMRGPGETKVELDRRKIENQIVSLSAELEKIKKTRAQNWALRRKNGVKSVVLGGYTNAGKSSLFNLLTKEQIYADDKLFATLDTTSRKIFLNGTQAVLTDTVGFISKLPHELVESFSATLEEVASADLILHVVDASNKFHRKFIEITNEILDSIGATENRLVVLNKCDLLTSPIEIKQNEILISTKTKKNVDKLRNLIEERLS